MQAESDARASPAKPGPEHFPAPVSASSGDFKAGKGRAHWKETHNSGAKVEYDDVYAIWKKKIDCIDQRESEEVEKLKDRLREALSPENLIVLVLRLQKDPKSPITVLSTKCDTAMCDKVCKAIQAEGLPKWMGLFGTRGEFCVSMRSGE